MEGTNRSNRKRLALVAAAAVGLAVGGLRPARAADAAGAPPGAAPASEPSKQELMDMLKAMQSKIDKLESKEQEQQSRIEGQAKEQAELQKRQVDLTVEQIRRDAERHSQLLDVTGISAGWNNKKKQFFLASDDGDFYFHPGIIFQFRGVVDHRDIPHGDTQLGFEIRRAKFYFDGNLFTPDLTYKFQWQDNSTGQPSLEYGWGQYVFAKNTFLGGDLAVRAGQAKNIVFKEEFTGDQNQLMVERSLANQLIAGNQSPGNLVQGVDLLLLGKNNPLHAELELTDGFGSGNTNFAQPHGTALTFPYTPADPATNPPRWGVETRVDYKVFGNWADTTDFTGVNSGEADLLDIGAGFDYTDSQGGQQVRYSVDAQYQMAKKISVFAAFYGDNFTYHGVKAGSPGAANNYGGIIEGGYRFDPAYQVVARYSLSKLSDNFKITNWGTFQEVAIGINYFGPNGSWGNHAKLSADLNYLPDGTPGAGGLDYLASSKRAAEVVLRTQFQLWF